MVCCVVGILLHYFQVLCRCQAQDRVTVHAKLVAENLPHNHRGGEDIDFLVVLVSFQNLGGHVRERSGSAGELVLVRQLAILFCILLQIDNAAKAEIRQLGHSLARRGRVKKHVFGFEVTVDDLWAARVQVSQALEYLNCPVQPLHPTVQFHIALTPHLVQNDFPDCPAIHAFLCHENQLSSVLVMESSKAFVSDYASME
mmetsp:Transcript_5753/g.16143  ORF Transcript_5753/g.16143 Transcript_5753/m.16143 type:complete len:200 (-) Transcript_5753:1152-1751(-)